MKMNVKQKELQLWMFALPIITRISLSIINYLISLFILLFFGKYIKLLDLFATISILIDSGVLLGACYGTHYFMKSFLNPYLDVDSIRIKKNFIVYILILMSISIVVYTIGYIFLGMNIGSSFYLSTIVHIFGSAYLPASILVMILGYFLWKNVKNSAKKEPSIPVDNQPYPFTINISIHYNNYIVVLISYIAVVWFGTERYHRVMEESVITLFLTMGVGWIVMNIIDLFIIRTLTQLTEYHKTTNQKNLLLKILTIGTYAMVIIHAIPISYFYLILYSVGMPMVGIVYSLFLVGLFILSILVAKKS